HPVARGRLFRRTVCVEAPYPGLRFVVALVNDELLSETQPLDPASIVDVERPIDNDGEPGGGDHDAGRAMRRPEVGSWRLVANRESSESAEKQITSRAGAGAQRNEHGQTIALGNKEDRDRCRISGNERAPNQVIRTASQRPRKDESRQPKRAEQPGSDGVEAQSRPYVVRVERIALWQWQMSRVEDVKEFFREEQKRRHGIRRDPRTAEAEEIRR